MYMEVKLDFKNISQNTSFDPRKHLPLATVNYDFPGVRPAMGSGTSIVFCLPIVNHQSDKSKVLG